MGVSRGSSVRFTSSKTRLLTVTAWMLASLYAAVMPRDLWLNTVYVAVSLAALMMLACTVSRHGFRAALTIIAGYALITGAPLAVAVVRGEVSVIYFWLLGINTILASMVIRELPPRESLLTARILLAAASALAIYVVSGDRADFDSGELIGGSSNLLTAALIGVACWHSYSSVLAGRRAPIFTPLALLAISVVFGGRSGIAIAAMLLSLNVGLRALVSRGFALAAAVIALIVVSVVPAEFVSDVVASTRLIHGFTDDIRNQMVSEYVRSLDALNVIFGAPYDPSGLIAFYGDNPHNSVIRAHHLFGLPALLVLFAIYLAALSRVIAKPAIGSVYPFALGSLVLLRSLYDIVYLWFEMDFILLSLLLSGANFASASVKSYVTFGGVPPQARNGLKMSLTSRR